MNTDQIEAEFKHLATKEEYDPDNTEGTRIAREVRVKANSFSCEERMRLLREGLAIIYGDKANHK
jgi:hypothetical protein